MSETRTHVGAGGRIVIPADWRRNLGIDIGDEVVLLLGDEGVLVLTPAQALRRAQAIVARHVPKGTRLSRSLIRDRRREAGRG